MALRAYIVRGTADGVHFCWGFIISDPPDNKARWYDENGQRRLIAAVADSILPTTAFDLYTRQLHIIRDA